MYSSISAGSIRPQLARTQRVCGAKKGCSSRYGTSSQAVSVAWRCWPRTIASGQPAGEDFVQQLRHLLGRDLLERDPRAAGQLDIDDRFHGAESDATGLDHVGLDFVRVEISPHGVHRRLGPGPEAAGAGADVDRRPHHAVAPQFGQPLLAEPPGFRVLRDRIGIDQPAEKFRAGVQRGRHGA